MATTTGQRGRETLGPVGERRARRTAAAPLACVIGDMDLIRPLARAGIPCAAVAPSGDPTRCSRFASAELDWGDHWTEPELLAKRLIRFARSQPSAPVAFAQTDGDLLLLSRHRATLAEFLRFTLPSASLIEDLLDKSRFARLAEELSLPVPRARVLSSAAGVDGLELTFPVVVKPLTRRFDVWTRIEGRAKAVGVDSPERLRALAGQLEDAGISALVQEAVPGGEERIESYHVYVDPAGEIAAEFTGRKLRTYPTAFGHTTALVTTRAHDVACLGRDITTRLGLRGVAKLDFKRTPGGELLLLEVNPRFSLWHHAGALAGVNVPALVYADLTGMPRPRVERCRAGVTWSLPWLDYAAARESGLSRRAWLAWALRCDARSVVSLDDPMPFLRGKVWRRLRSRLVPARAGR